MANSVGIDVKINMPSKSKVMEDLKSKWGTGADAPELLVNIRANKNSLNKMKGQVKSHFKDYVFEIDLKADFSKADRQLKDFRTQYQALREEMSSGLELKFDPGKTMDKNVQALLSGNSQKMQQSQRANQQYIDNIRKQAQQINASTQKATSKQILDVSNTLKELDKTETRINAFKKQVQEVSNEKITVKTEMTQSEGIKQYVQLTKDVYDLEKKRVGTTGQVADEYQNVINKLNEARRIMANDFKNEFGKDINSNVDIAKAEGIGKANVALQEQIRLQNQQKADDAERASRLKEIVRLENEVYKISKEAQKNDGQSFKDAYQSRIDAIKKEISAKEQSVQFNEKEKASLASLRAENESQLNFAQRLSQAKSQETARIHEQKAALSELKNDLKAIQKIELDVSKLKAKQSAEATTQKEDLKLKELESELKIRRDIYELDKRIASSEGQLSDKGKSELSTLERKYSLQRKMSVNIDKEKADVAKQAMDYKELYDSVDRVAKLKKDSATAGRHELDVIKQIVAEEEKRQSELQQSLKLQGKMTDEEEKRLNTTRKQKNEEAEQQGLLNRGRKQDSDANRPHNSRIVAAVDPIRLAEMGKRAFDTVYDSVASLDKEMVAIAKVVDAPDEVLKEFSQSVFDTATSVGKGADEFAGSVAKWATTGKSFQESVELSKVSVMGAFVGDVDEDSMMKYLNVPLKAFEEDALEATDVINAMNEVANNNNAEMTELGEAYVRAANTSQSAGNSFAELTGLITAAQEATNAGGEKIGTALKYVDTTVGQINTKSTKAQEKAFNDLNKMGVELRDGQGNLRSTYDILGDLAGRWKYLSPDERTTATMAIAGKNHANVIQGIVKQWGIAEKATKEAQDQINLTNKEGGSAFQEFAKQQDSVEFKTVALKNAWREFLNTIAGGKDGVNGLLEVFTDIVNVGNELVSNDRFMEFAGGLIKIGGSLLALIAARKGLKFVTNEISALTQAGSHLTHLFSGGLFGTAKMTVPGVEGSIKSVGLLGKSMTRLVPIVGGVLLAMELLDMAGIPVWETLGKVVEKVGEYFKSAKDKAKEANEEFVKTQKEIGEKLQNNSWINGTLEKTDKLFDNYTELNKQKEKLYEDTGDKNVFRYSSDEFETLKKDFSQAADALGVDIELTMNDYDDIKSKYEELIRLANQLTTKEIDKAVSETRKSLKPKDLSKDEAAYKEQRKNLKDSIDTEELTLKTGPDPRLGMNEAQTKEWENSLKERIEENKKLLAGLDTFNDSDAAFKAALADRERNKNIKVTSDKVVKDAKSGFYDENFSQVSKESQKEILGYITKEGQALKNSSKVYKDAQKDLKDSIDTFDNGTTEHNKVSDETLRAVHELGGEYKDLGTDVESWSINGKDAGSTMQDVMDKLKEKTKGVSEETKTLRDKLSNFSKEAGFSDEVKESMFNAFDNGGKSLIQFMSDQFGEYGASMLGIGSVFLHEFGKDWSSELMNLQGQIDKFSSEDMEKAIKFDLVTEDGLVNGESLDMLLTLPDEIKTKFSITDDGGNINMDGALDFVNQLDEAKFDEEFTKKITVDGEIDLTKFEQEFKKLEEGSREQLEVLVALNIPGAQEALDKLDEVEAKAKETDGKESNVEVNVKDNATETLDEVGKKTDETNGKKANVEIDAKDNASPKVNEASQNVENLDGKTSTAQIEANTADLNQKLNDSYNDIGNFDSNTNGTAEINGDKSNLDSNLNASTLSLVSFDGSKATANILANRSSFDQTVSEVRSTDITVTARIALAASGIASKVKSIVSSATGSVSTQSIAQSVATSMSVGAEAVAKAQQSQANKSNSTSSSSSSRSGNPRYANDKINQDIWRYWSKELFNGMPLESAMKDLERAIDKSSDNEAKLINLYKQQQALMDKQIKHEQDMKKATQSEMNAILSDLRKQGFKTSGNRVTNLNHAKSIKGEDAISLANENLNKYNDLYKRLDDYTQKILDLRADKSNLNNDIKDAKVAKELKSIESRIKKTEALLTAISNNTDIANKKVGMVDSLDYELSLTFNEEAMNQNKNGIKSLVNEFNALSKMTVQYGENAEEIQGQLDSLKDQILSNADAIIEYQQAINDIQIDRLMNDMDKFTDSMSRNIDKVNSNVEQLQDGLLSGTKLSDLQSSELGSLSINRKTELERQYEERLSLEAKLNETLEAYAKKNIDRTGKVANSILTIEQGKYAQLLKLQKEFSNGKVGSVTSIKPDAVVGNNKAQTDKKNSAWVKEMEKVNNDYVRAYNSMVTKYEKAMDGAKTQTARDAITNEFIISQLNLQEEMYRKMIDANKSAIEQARNQLKDTGLTTSQRDDLEQYIRDLEDQISESQDAIKESVRSRYEMEFDLLDELADKAKDYTNELEELLNINDAVNNDPSSRNNLLDSIYESYVNQYGNARKELAKLTSEQSKLSEGSMEWKMLQERIEEVRDSLNGLTLDVLDANKAVMENQIDTIQSQLEKGLFNGMTSDEWSEYNDKWMTGVEKELELDKIRRRSMDLESDLYDKKIEALDRQEAVSKKDLEYLDKQMSVLELEEKLQGLQSERNVQTLVQNPDGSWQFQYVADQTEIDKTQDDLDDAKQELSKFQEEQRANYFKDLSGILDDARDGKFDNEDDLRSALQTLQDAYGYVLSDIPGLDMGNFDDILRVYQEYLNNNKDIVSGVGDGELSPEYEELIDRVGIRFEQGFTNIASELGEVIAEAIRNSLYNAQEVGLGENYVIERQELVFPNVSDTTGFREVLETLPAATKQRITEKV